VPPCMLASVLAQVKNGHISHFLHNCRLVRARVPVAGALSTLLTLRAITSQTLQQQMQGYSGRQSLHTHIHLSQCVSSTICWVNMACLHSYDGGGLLLHNPPQRRPDKTF